MSDHSGAVDGGKRKRRKTVEVEEEDSGGEEGEEGIAATEGAGSRGRPEGSRRDLVGTDAYKWSGMTESGYEEIQTFKESGQTPSRLKTAHARAHFIERCGRFEERQGLLYFTGARRKDRVSTDCAKH